MTAEAGFFLNRFSALETEAFRRISGCTYSRIPNVHGTTRRTLRHATIRTSSDPASETLSRTVGTIAHRIDITSGTSSETTCGAVRETAGDIVGDIVFGTAEIVIRAGSKPACRTPNDVARGTRSDSPNEVALEFVSEVAIGTERHSVRSPTCRSTCRSTCKYPRSARIGTGADRCSGGNVPEHHSDRIAPVMLLRFRAARSSSS
jgi:hypothetical protein